MLNGTIIPTLKFDILICPIPHEAHHLLSALLDIAPMQLIYLIQNCLQHIQSLELAVHQLFNQLVGVGTLEPIRMFLILHKKCTIEVVSLANLLMSFVGKADLFNT